MDDMLLLPITSQSPLWMIIFMHATLLLSILQNSSSSSVGSESEASVTALCGSAPQPLNLSTPNVLIIGDSISMGFGVNDADTGYGYGLNVAKMLAGPYPQFYSLDHLAGGLATVQHSGGSFGSNGGNSVNGAKCIDHWLGAGISWDIITVRKAMQNVDSNLCSIHVESCSGKPIVCSRGCDRDGGPFPR